MDGELTTDDLTNFWNFLADGLERWPAKAGLSTTKIVRINQARAVVGNFIQTMVDEAQKRAEAQRRAAGHDADTPPAQRPGQAMVKMSPEAKRRFPKAGMRATVAENDDAPKGEKPADPPGTEENKKPQVGFGTQPERPPEQEGKQE